MDIPQILTLGIERGEDVRALLRQQYGENYYGAHPQYFEWLYLQAPCRWFAHERNAGRLPINAILRDDGGLGAVHAFVPFDLWAPWGGGIGIWDIEWINRSGIKGAGRALARYLHNSVDVYAGFGCNELSATAFQSLGFHVIPEIHRRVALLDAQRLGEILARSSIPTQNSFPPQVAELHTRFEILPGTAAIAKAALATYQELTPFGASRSVEWLAWRYDTHPFIKYSVIAADGGAAIVRLERITGTDANVCRVLEFFPSRDGEPALLAATLCFAKESDALLLDYFVTSSNHAERFSQAAIGIGIELAANPDIPYMYQPVEIGKAKTPNIVLAVGGRASAAGEVDFGTFQAGKGDANQDILRRVETSPKPSTPIKVSQPCA